MKIHIIGCSGSGKTYLANALSKKYNISHFDLDDIQWDNNAKEYGKKRTLDERKAPPEFKNGSILRLRFLKSGI